MDTKSHIIKRAIIMAAGIGARMQPLTFETPKPLVRVNGIRMIDTVIQGLQKNGIYEIYIVVGYLKEMFYTLKSQYPSVEIIENPYFKTCNNISSLYVARQYLSDCMILDGDQVIYNDDVLCPFFKRSGYNAVWTESSTEEWLLKIKEGIVQDCSRTGGSNGWQLYSISRWTAEDGKKLKNQLEYEFEHGNNQIYWDDIPIFCYPQEYKLGVFEMKKTDVIEIDCLEELVAIDSSYKKYLF